MSKLPPLAPFPPADIRPQLALEEWHACLDAWVALASAHLLLNDSDFVRSITTDSSLARFLSDFFNQVSRTPATDTYLSGLRFGSLKKKCFLLTHRILSTDKTASVLLNWPFLSSIAHTFPRSEHVKKLFSSLWTRKQDALETELQSIKSSLIKVLESSRADAADEDLAQISHLLYASPEAGAFFMTGSDFLDAMCSAYSKTASNKLRSSIVTVLYLGLRSIIEAQKPNYSLLSDILYTLKSNAEQTQKSSSNDRPSILADLVTNTPILRKIQDRASNTEGARARNSAASLSTFRQPAILRVRKHPVRRAKDKGKGRATEPDMHIHQMSLVTQIQDLFPELGAGFVVKLFKEYGDNVEQVTAHLLDDSLPLHLKNADRTEQIHTNLSGPPPRPHLTPRPTPPLSPIVSKTFDAFDDLSISADRFHIGRAERAPTAAPTSASILSALAAFDGDDDERDDTYDAEDVGGLIDSRESEADGQPDNRYDEALFLAWTATPALFARDAATRRSEARKKLRDQTSLTDEAVEGWAVMLSRDPGRLRRLRNRFEGLASSAPDNLGSLARTSYRKPQDEDEGDTDEGNGTDQGGYGGRGGRGGRGGARGGGRGRGGGNRGRGGGSSSSVSGPADQKDTQIARNRKESNKGSRANHNRRDQRAKKMARGGGGFPAAS